MLKLRSTSVDRTLLRCGVCSPTGVRQKRSRERGVQKSFGRLAQRRSHELWRSSRLLCKDTVDQARSRQRHDRNGTGKPIVPLLWSKPRHCLRKSLFKLDLTPGPANVAVDLQQPAVSRATSDLRTTSVMSLRTARRRPSYAQQ